MVELEHLPVDGSICLVDDAVYKSFERKYKNLNFAA